MKVLESWNLHRWKGVLISFIFLISGTLLVGQTNDINGIPLIKNFSKNEVKSNAKVFDISQSENGEVFFATPEALITFDGHIWDRYAEKNKTDLRDVLFVSDQEIYTSGHGGFGVWSRNSFGRLTYKSLFYKTPTKEAPLLPVFNNIIKIENRIYFQSFQQIYVYDTLKKSIEIIYAAKGFINMFVVDGKLLVQDSYLGLYEIKGIRKFLIEGTKNHFIEIINVLKDNDGLLIATKNNGFWELINEKMEKKSWSINAVFKKNLINDAIQYNEKSFLVGSLRDGVYLISKQGKVLSKINKDQGISNNSIRKVFKDNNDNVWVATEGGLSYIEWNSNLKFISDKRSEFGTVFSSFLKDSILYLGTNQGLFKKNIKTTNSKPILLDNSVEQIWQIFETDGQILIGGHKGVFKLERNRLRTVHLEGGAWTFRIHPKFSDLMYVGFYSGLAVFKKINGEWRFLKKFENFGESSRFLEFDSNNQAWVAHPSKGYYRLKLSNDGLFIDTVDFYGVSNPAVDTFAYFTKIDDNLVFYNPAGFFVYNALDDSFSKADYPQRVFEGLKNIYFIKQYENLFWYSTDRSVGYIQRNRGEFKKVQSPFYSVWDRNLKDFNNFNRLNDELYGINIEDGFAIYSYKENSNYSSAQIPVLKSIDAISFKDTVRVSLQSLDRITIPYENNNLKITIALPNLPFGSSRAVQYRLKGFQEQWSQKEDFSEIYFAGLDPGDYDLEIKSILDVNKTSQSIIVPITIIQPWYLHNITKVTYVVFFFLTFYVYSVYLRNKNKKYVTRLKEIEQQRRQRQKEKYELEKLVSDKELLLLKEKNLNVEIKKKSSALASSTLNNIKKNELLSDIIKDVNNIDKELLNVALHYPIKKIIKKINSHLKDKEDWLTFELHFRNSHSQFFENLRNAHPDLSSNEIKLSAYLKLNLSSKEIASLMHVAITSVEQSRYRLRKKMKLRKDDSLSQYIQNF